MNPIESIKIECQRRLKENHDKIIIALKNFSSEEIWARPNPASNSIGNLILHLSGNLSQYVLSSLGGQTDQRERSKEFEAQDLLSANELLIKLAEILSAVYSVIDSCDETELMRHRQVQCFEETGIGILIHVTEHFSYHTGQIIYYVKLKEGKAMNFYQGVDLEKRG